MATIEERVVAMKFQGEQFLAGIDKSLQKLEQLNSKLKMAEGAKAFEGVGAAADKQHASINRIAESVQHVSDRFKTLGVVGMAALSNITNQAIFAGQNLAKSLTIEPILQGFREYELNMNSIQTILANTQAAGTKLEDVTAALDELNHYSDQTIYNFAEMAKNIGTFTAAGVGLEPATAAIKGIANLAALSGSNSQQASAAMYQLSQAISAGRVSLEDWNSVVNAGMGGTVFQRALAQTAVTMGTLSDESVKLEGDMKNVSIAGKSFRESITAKPGQESWLTSDVLTKTLAQFTGDLKDAELAAMGFNAEQIKAIQAQAKIAQQAATEVKTLSQLLGTLKESAGSGWSQTWKTIFGDFPEAKTLFTDVNNVIGGFLSASADARNQVLKDWKELGGRTFMIEAIGNAFKALVEVVKPIRTAFRDIFPQTTGAQLAAWSKSLRDFTSNLSVSGSTAEKIASTFRGFFAALDIGRMIIVEFVQMFFRLLGVTTEGAGGLLDFTANIGDWVVKVRDALKNGENLSKFFRGLEKVLTVPIQALRAVIGLIVLIASKFPSIDAGLAPLAKIGALANMAWEKVASSISFVWSHMRGFGEWAKGFFGELGKDISSALEGLDFKDVLNGINTGLFAGLIGMIYNLIGGGGVGGIIENLSEAFENLTGALGAMQNTLRAATLLQIAIAVGILAVSMNTLSKIDSAGLTRASAAITVMFTQLLGALLIFEKFSGFEGFAKMPFVALSMILMATAINILASAVEKLADLEWEDLAKGLTGTTALIAGLTTAVNFMPNTGKMIASGAAMILLAAGVRILVGAVSSLSGLSWEELGKGLTGVAAILTALGLFTKFADTSKGGVLAGAGLILLAVGVRILADAVREMSDLSWDEIGRGLTTMAGAMTIMVASLMLIPPTAPLAALGVLGVALSLGMIADALQQLAEMSWGDIGKSLTAMLGAMTIIAAALFVIPPTAPLGAAGILIVALSLGMIGDALERFAAFSWEEIGKSMTLLAGSLGIIATAMIFMTTALPGAAALIVVAGALAILTPVLTTLGAMSWEEIGKGLLALAAALTIIGIAGVFLTPVVPTLLGLGAAIALLGAGLALVGAGVFLFATGLTLVAASGVAAAGAIVAMIDILLGSLPRIVELTNALLVALLQLIIDAAPKLGEAAVVLITVILQAVVKLAPMIIAAIGELLVKLYTALSNYVPRLAVAGINLITGLLNGIAQNIGRVVTAATNLIVAFLRAIGDNLPRVQQAGVDLIIRFVNGLASTIANNSGRMREAGRNLAFAIIDGITGGLLSGAGRAISAAADMASSALAAAKNVLGIKSPSKEFYKIGEFVNQGFANGLRSGAKDQVNKEFGSLQAQINTAYNASVKAVGEAERKMRQIWNTRSWDTAALKAQSKVVADAKAERDRLYAASVQLSRHLQDERNRLNTLADSYGDVTKKLEDATKAYEDAVKTRDDYSSKIRDQYDDLPKATGQTSLLQYMTDLRKQVSDTKEFTGVLQNLRDLGLNDEMYDQLLGTGASALPFIKELLEGGKLSVDEINQLSKELDSAAGSLGSQAGSELYQAAVDSAAGIVKGLQDQQEAIKQEMEHIASYMVDAIKKALGIKSPSRVFAEVGTYSAQGLSNGLRKGGDAVAKTAEGVGNRAVDSMRLSLAGIDKMVANTLDVQPVIRPVLDLTEVQKSAGKMGNILPSNYKMTLDGASANASVVAREMKRRFDDDDPDGDGGRGGTVSYTQNIFSPKAVDSITVYRGTRSQLSTVKGALST